MYVPCCCFFCFCFCSLCGRLPWSPVFPVWVGLPALFVSRLGALHAHHAPARSGRSAEKAASGTQGPMRARRATRLRAVGDRGFAEKAASGTQGPMRARRATRHASHAPERSAWVIVVWPASLESGFSRLGWTPIPDFACGVHLASILVSPSMPANEERSPHQMSLLDCSRFKSDIFSELYYFWRDSAITQSNG